MILTLTVILWSSCNIERDLVYKTQIHRENEEKSMFRDKKYELRINYVIHR